VTWKIVERGGCRMEGKEGKRETRRVPNAENKPLNCTQPVLD